MALLGRLFTFTAGTTILSSEVNSEFNQLVNLVNGTSTSIEAVIRFSGTNPTLILDNLSSGQILRMRKNGVEVASVENDGSIKGLRGEFSINSSTNIALTATNTNTSSSALIQQWTGVSSSQLGRISTQGSLEIIAGAGATPSTTFVKVGGSYTTSVTTFNNSGSGETDAFSFTIKANVLSSNGDELIYHTELNSTNTDTKTIKIYYGGTLQHTFPTITTTSNSIVTVRFVRIDSTTMFAVIKADGGMTQNTTIALSGVDHAVDKVLKFTLQGTTSSTIQQRVTRVNKYSAIAQ